MTEYKTYDFRSFEDLKIFFDLSAELYQLKEDLEVLFGRIPQSIRAFVGIEDFRSKVEEFHQYSNSQKTFEKRFFQWFDGFKVLKFVHFARDNYYSNIAISAALEWLFDKYNEPRFEGLVPALIRLRELNSKMTRGVGQPPHSMGYLAFQFEVIRKLSNGKSEADYPYDEVWISANGERVSLD